MPGAIAKYVPIFGMLLILITMPAFSGSAFGVASIASDKASDNAALKAPPFQPRIIEYGDLTAIAVPMYTTVDNPANHEVISGGITEKNIQRFARTGVDMISVGQITNSVRGIDLSLEV